MLRIKPWAIPFNTTRGPRAHGHPLSGTGSFAGLIDGRDCCLGHQHMSCPVDDVQIPVLAGGRDARLMSGILVEYRRGAQVMILWIIGFRLIPPLEPPRT